MITKEEFKKTYIRMMDSVRGNHYKGSKTCNGIECEDCPLSKFCNDDSSSRNYRVFDLIEMVEKWGKEHPIITRADKYKEVFGVEPKYLGGSFICPGIPRDQDYCDSHTCEECKSNYWNAEYIEPEKENKNV